MVYVENMNSHDFNIFEGIMDYIFNYKTKVKNDKISANDSLTGFGGTQIIPLG